MSKRKTPSPLSLTPFHVAGMLFLAVGLIFSLYMGLAQFDVVPGVSWMMWSHLHYVTIGGFTQLIFGMLPQLTAQKLDRPKPSKRYTWFNFITLNGAFLVLWYGRAWNNVLAFDLGLYAIFLLVVLLWLTLFKMVMKSDGDKAWNPTVGMYLVSVFVFMWGIVYAYGLYAHTWNVPGGWLGLREGHVHANGWGFLGLTVIATLHEVFPKFAEADLHSERLQGYSFWFLSIGIFPLITGPWLGMGRTITMTGIILFGTGYALFLYNIVKTYFAGSRSNLALSVLLSQFWLLAPAGFAPFVIFGIEWVDPALIERGALHWFFMGWALPVALGGLVLYGRSLSCPLHGRPGVDDEETAPAVIVNDGILSAVPRWMVWLWNLAIVAVGVGFFYQNTDWSVYLFGPGYTILALIWGYELVAAIYQRRSARGEAVEA